MSLIYMGRACEKETKSITISFYFLEFLLHKDPEFSWIETVVNLTGSWFALTSRFKINLLRRLYAKDEQRSDTHHALSIWNLIHFL
jgi:hypothetical protein